MPVQDVGLIAAVQAGQVEPVAAVDVVRRRRGRARRRLPHRPRTSSLLATGYRRGLEPLVGDLGVLDDRGVPTRTLPGLYFTGYTNPISGMFRELRLDARKIARAVARRRATTDPTPSRSRTAARRSATTTTSGHSDCAPASARSVRPTASPSRASSAPNAASSPTSAADAVTETAGRRMPVPRRADERRPEGERAEPDGRGDPVRARRDVRRERGDGQRRGTAERQQDATRQAARAAGRPP